MVSYLLLIFQLLAFIGKNNCLRLLMLDIPSPTIFGESVELQCSYELDDDQLYSVKWYKNDVEFYRYVPNDWPSGQFLPIPGIRVDLSRSGKDSVYLRQVDLKSEGIYRCEVSAEAPEFKTAELEKEMKVFLLPTEGPRITGGKAKYQIGDEVKINCTSALSKPAPSLKWYLNDQLAPTYYEKQYPLKIINKNGPGLEQVTLGLHFTINSKHFYKGELRMRCTASIHRVYAMSTHSFGTLQGVHNHSRPFHFNENHQGKHNHNSPILSKENKENEFVKVAKSNLPTKSSSTTINLSGVLIIALSTNRLIIHKKYLLSLLVHNFMTLLKLFKT